MIKFKDDIEKFFKELNSGKTDFSGIDLSGLALSIYSDISGYGKNINLRNINFSGANLSETYFDGIDLSGADLSNANLSKARLKGTNLTGANLTRANLTEAELNGANFKNANLTGATLCKIRIYIETSFLGADLSNVNLSEASLQDFKGFAGINLINSNLSNVMFWRVNLDNTNLSQSNLTRASLIQCSLKNTNIEEANLEKSTLSGSDFFEANLKKSNLEGAKLSSITIEAPNPKNNTRIPSARLMKTNIQGANFNNANLVDVIMPDGELNGKKPIDFFNSALKNLAEKNITEAKSDLSTARELFRFTDNEEYIKKIDAKIEEISANNNCFIVTATFGSPYAEEVIKFRNFRDNYLENILMGKLFMKIYYLVGPTFAKIIKRNTLLKNISAFILNKISNLLSL